MKSEVRSRKSEVGGRRSEIGINRPTSDLRLPPSALRLPTSDLRLLTSDLRPPTSDSRHGQAIIELVVGLVVMLIVFAGLLQIGGLNRLHTRTMIEARSDAANRMFFGAATPDAHYILDCTPGPDGRRYTRDDAFDTAAVGNFQGHVLAYAKLIPLEGVRPHNSINNLDTDPTALDLVHGQQTYATNLYPIMRDLVYGTNSIDVHSDVFMTRIEGLP